MDYSPLSESDIADMLANIGIDHIDELFQDIPEVIRNPEVNISLGKSEMEIFAKLKKLSEQNMVYNSYFCGVGVYNHFIPPVVKEICQRNEFYTSYTPYQAEISQGFLQSIYEYQTSICNLTAMDATNASVYDGATAVCEAIIMARKITRNNKILCIQPVHPEYLRVIQTYGNATDFEIVYTSLDTYIDRLESDEYAAVLIQNPDFFGTLHDISRISKNVKENSKKTLVVYICVEATSLGLLKRPGLVGVDIVCGDGQSLGLPMSFGGPTAGFITTVKKHMRKLPGRIVGKTKELNGDKSGYILTLQAREQHIRREKALSNICSNEALCMLAIQVYLSAMGYSGLRKVAESCVKNINYLRNKLRQMEKITIIDADKPIYNEFLFTIPKYLTKNIKSSCELNAICPPYQLSTSDMELLTQGTDQEFDVRNDYFIICSTELHEKSTIDGLIKLFQEAEK